MTEMQPSHSSDARGDGLTLRLLWPQWQAPAPPVSRPSPPNFPSRWPAGALPSARPCWPPSCPPTRARPRSRQWPWTTLPSCGSIATRHRHPGQPASRVPRHGGGGVDRPRGPGGASAAPSVRLPGACRVGRVARLGHRRHRQHGPLGDRFLQPGRAAGNDPAAGDWLAGTGCSRVAIHFDVDTIDSNELVLGLGAEPGGLTTAQVRRIVDDLDAVADVVGSPSPSSSPAKSCTYSSS